jgi:flagellar hook-associated protein 2
MEVEGAMSIGLSFGSPTSGDGFDVTTTVSSIVANLQNVETPWKTQLTTLESQDTAISSLGTLFSNLSNDMSSLTDAEGIMAQKTGSSSNTDVLELTAASSSAVAGTHTVVVTSLAQTSSGYLTPITTSTDTLAGSISIAVGSGTAQKVTLDSSDDTLTEMASAINAAGIGVTASVLTDSSGSRLSLVSGTSGAGGNLTVTSSITDTSNSGTALTYTKSATGADAVLTVDGISLTSASNTVANLIPGVTFQLLSDAPSTQVQVVIGNDTSDVKSTVNAMVNDYNSLVSAMNTQEGNDSSGNAEPLYGSPTLSLLQQQLLGGLNAQNPNGYLDSITDASDALSGSISIEVGSGTAQTVTLDDSTGYTLADLATAINSASIGVTASVVTSSTGSQLVMTSGTAGTSGALKVTSSIEDTTNSDTTLKYTSSSDINSLTSLGISVNNDGTISLSATSLDSVLNSDYSSVVGFFQNVNSWGLSFSTTLTNAGSTSTTGILKLAASSNSSTESTLNADISKEGVLISSESKSLTSVLNSANEVLQEIPMQISEVNELYSAITGYNQKS